MNRSKHVDPRTLLDHNESAIERAIAARRLSDQNAQNVLDVLLTVAQDEHEDEHVSHAAGESMAEILIRRDEIDIAPLHDFTGAAYLGFDEVVGRYQRSSGA